MGPSHTFSSIAEDLWRRRNLLVSCPAEAHPAPVDVISSLITSLSETLETVPDLKNDHTEYWSSQVKAMQGTTQETYDFPTPPKGNAQPSPSNATIPSIVRSSKPPSGLSPPTTPTTAPLKNRLQLTSSRSQKQNEEHAAQDGVTALAFGEFSIEPTPRDLSLKASEKEGNTNIRPPKSLVPKSSKEKMREIDREWKRNPINPANEDSKKSSRRVLNVRTIDSSPVSPSLLLDETLRPDVRLSLPIPARGSSIRTDSGAKRIIAAVDNSSGSSNGIRRVPTRDSSLRHSSGLTPPRHKRRSQRSDYQSKSDTRRLPPRAQYSSMNTIEKVSDDTTEDDVIKRIQELKAQKDRRSRQSIEDSQSFVAGDLSLLSLPIKSSLRRTFPHDSYALQNSIFNGSRFVTGQDDAATFIESNGNPPNMIQGGVTAKTSIAPVTPSSSPTQAKSILRTTSTSRIKRPISFGSSESPKRAFTNPLSQVMWTSQYDDRTSTADSVDDVIEDYLFSYRLSQKIKHPQTGRVVSFSEVGDPDGYAVFCCVGMGLTRYITAFYDELALKLRLRLITPERPGIGESEAYTDGSDTPLGWPDDILQICQHLEITRFSLLAHSAGAVYALATALRMPQFIRGRIHLLAPWIPPSQMAPAGTHPDSLPLSALPYSQRILRALPISFLKAANSTFLSTTSASVTTGLGKSPRRSKRKSMNQEAPRSKASPTLATVSRSQQPSLSPRLTANCGDACAASNINVESPGLSTEDMTELRTFTTERQTDYDIRLTRAIWDLATMDSNPAVDLVVCLERRQPIGFRYVDVRKAVVIHHGSKDNRVPVDNVKRLGNAMRRCEVRILEGEGHGLMASATVMGDVLVEIGKEWEDWNSVVQGKKKRA